MASNSNQETEPSCSQPCGSRLVKYYQQCCAWFHLMMMMLYGVSCVLPKLALWQTPNRRWNTHVSQALVVSHEALGYAHSLPSSTQASCDSHGALPRLETMETASYTSCTRTHGCLKSMCSQIHLLQKATSSSWPWLHYQLLFLSSSSLNMSSTSNIMV